MSFCLSAGQLSDCSFANMSTIQRVAGQARKTFLAINSPAFKGHLENLKSMMNSLTASDINLVIPKQFSDDTHGAPVSHINIYECSFFTIGVFILKQGSQLPLHDHPGMSGVIKVLCGSLRIHSYTDLENSDKAEGERAIIKLRGIPFQCKPASDRLLTSDSESHCLTPMSENYHSIQNASPGPTAFLDILGPPYEPEKGRDCSYFRECDPVESKESATTTVNTNDVKSTRWLVRIPPPRDFYCDSQPYRGPPITL